MDKCKIPLIHNGQTGDDLPGLKKIGIRLECTDPNIYLTTAEVMELIDKSQATVYRYILAGKLPKRTVGGKFRMIDVVRLYTASKVE